MEDYLLVKTSTCTDEYSRSINASCIITKELYDLIIKRKRVKLHVWDVDVEDYDTDTIDFQGESIKDLFGMNSTQQYTWSCFEINQFEKDTIIKFKLLSGENLVDLLLEKLTIDYHFQEFKVYCGGKL